MSEDCQPKKIATYAATHHQYIWRRQCLGLGLRVVGRLVKERTEKGYSPVASMYLPDSRQLEIEHFLREPFLAEENVSMIVKKV